MSAIAWFRQPMAAGYGKFSTGRMELDREQILENRQKLRTRYGDLFDSIAGILFRHDPARVNC